MEGASPNLPTPRWLAPLVALLVAPCFAVKVKDYDVWWHMATGRWILAHGRLPATDPFTYTMAGKPLHGVNAIADLLFFGAWRLGADTALVLLKVAVAWLTLSLLGLSFRRLGVSRAVTVSLVLLTALLVHGRYTLDRPLVMGAALLAAGNLAAVRTSITGDRSFLFFVVALPLWPLVHSNALLGLAQLAAVLAAAVIARAPRRRRVTLAIAFGACLAISAALPWWRDLYFVAASLKPSATAMQLTAEWRTGVESLPVRVGHWLAMAGAIAGGLARARKNALPLLLALVGAAAASQWGRNAYEGVLLAMPALACGLDDVAAAFRARERLLFAYAAAPLAAFAIGAVQLALAPFVTIGGPFGFGVVRGLFPYDTLETLRRLPVHRLINGFPIGGFLIWNDGPWGVYCDGRTVALYTEEDVRRLFVPLVESDATLTAAADEWGAAYGLAENLSHPQQWMMISPSWVPLHIGEGTTLFVRRNRLGEMPPDVVPLELVRFAEDRRWVDGFYTGVLRDAKLRDQLKGEFAEAARLSPESPLLVEIVRAVAHLDAAYAEELEGALATARQARQP